MSIYDKNHYNIVISLQLIKINEKKDNKILDVEYNSTPLNWLIEVPLLPILIYNIGNKMNYSSAHKILKITGVVIVILV